MKRRGFLIALGALSGCGYHVGGKADLMPKSIHTIAVPTFGNNTPRLKISDRMASAVTREFLTRTRYTVIANPEEADAVLRGTVRTVNAYPTVFDQVSGRAAGVQITITMDVTLTERTTGRVLFSRPNYEMRERYEISIDPSQYFEESETALERLTRDMARSIVSAVLSGF